MPQSMGGSQYVDRSRSAEWTQAGGNIASIFMEQAKRVYDSAKNRYDMLEQERALLPQYKWQEYMIDHAKDYADAKGMMDTASRGIAAVWTTPIEKLRQSPQWAQDMSAIESWHKTNLSTQSQLGQIYDEDFGTTPSLGAPPETGTGQPAAEQPPAAAPQSDQPAPTIRGGLRGWKPFVGNPTDKPASTWTTSPQSMIGQPQFQLGRAAATANDLSGLGGNRPWTSEFVPTQALTGEGKFDPLSDTWYADESIAKKALEDKLTIEELSQGRPKDPNAAISKFLSKLEKAGVDVSTEEKKKKMADYFIASSGLTPIGKLTGGKDGKGIDIPGYRVASRRARELKLLFDRASIAKPNDLGGALNVVGEMTDLRPEERALLETLDESEMTTYVPAPTQTPAAASRPPNASSVIPAGQAPTVAPTEPVRLKPLGGPQSSANDIQSFRDMMHLARASAPVNSMSQLGNQSNAVEVLQTDKPGSREVPPTQTGGGTPSAETAPNWLDSLSSKADEEINKQWELYLESAKKEAKTNEDRMRIGMAEDAVRQINESQPIVGGALEKLRSDNGGRLTFKEHQAALKQNIALGKIDDIVQIGTRRSIDDILRKASLDPRQNQEMKRALMERVASYSTETLAMMDPQAAEARIQQGRNDLEYMRLNAAKSTGDDTTIAMIKLGYEKAKLMLDASTDAMKAGQAAWELGYKNGKSERERLTNANNALATFMKTSSYAPFVESGLKAIKFLSGLDAKMQELAPLLGKRNLLEVITGQEKPQIGYKPVYEAPNYGSRSVSPAPASDADVQTLFDRYSKKP